jgi:hypothetical protein
MRTDLDRAAKSSTGERKAEGLVLKVIPLEPPWEACLLAVSSFPMTGEELQKSLALMGSLTAALSRKYGLSAETFLQLEQLKPAEARICLSDNGRDWLPEVGLGVWPNRDAPATWTQEEFMNIVPGEKLRPLMFQVFHVTASAATKAHDAMFAFGSTLQILTTGPIDVVLQKAKAKFLPKINDRSYRSFPFYVPLLDEEAVKTAPKGQLDEWLCGASAYIRGSYEDKGVLILSNVPLAESLRSLGGQLEEKHKSEWRF